MNDIKDIKENSTGNLISRLIVSMIVIALTNMLTPGVTNVKGLLNLALISIAIAAIQHILSGALGLSKTHKGCSGFLVMALIIYLAGQIVPGYKVSVIGAIIGGLVFGMVDAIIPGKRLHR